MKIFDPHIRSLTQSDDDLKNLHYFGTEEVVTVAHGGQSFETAAQLMEYFRTLIDDETRRLRRCQLQPHVALGVVPDARPRRAHPEVWDELEQLLQLREVVALGELGVWEDEDDQWELFDRQVDIARRVGPLPLLVMPPRRLKINLTYKMMNRLEKTGYPTSLVVMTSLDERLLENVVESGFCAGFPVGATRNDPREVGALVKDILERVDGADRIMLTSSLRSSGGDLIGIPKSIESMREARLEESVIRKMVRGNARRLFGSGDEP